MVEQIQAGGKPGCYALLGGEWPWSIHDMQEEVGVCTGLQAIPSLDLRQASGGDVRLKNAWRDDLESVFKRRAGPRCEPRQAPPRYVEGRRREREA